MFDSKHSECGLHKEATVTIKEEEIETECGVNISDFKTFLKGLNSCFMR